MSRKGPNCRRIALATLLLACGGDHPGLGARVAYDVYEAAPYPLKPGSIVTGGLAGSCLTKQPVDYRAAAALTWVPGTGLEIHASWPDRTDCSGLLTAQCLRVSGTIASTNDSVWKTGLDATGTAEWIISVFAQGPGTGGFKLFANGQEFQPDFVLAVAQPSAIWIERTNGPRSDQLVPGRIDHLDVVAGGDAGVAVTLRDSAGQHLCGPIPATVTIDTDAFSLEHFTDGDFVNIPYHIVTGAVPGSGTIRFVVGDLSASLAVNVTAE
ncbi:MAG TPA: hypothetical protein VFE90_09660 [Myxococcales bacterium]|jgi:hypothetical protein|nr:hypothetical protein [Myxococcales bacterium]